MMYYRSSEVSNRRLGTYRVAILKQPLLLLSHLYSSKTEFHGAGLYSISLNNISDRIRFWFDCLQIEPQCTYAKFPYVIISKTAR